MIEEQKMTEKDIGWIAHFKDGSTLTEAEAEWDDIQKELITSLQLKHPKTSRTFSIAGDYQYFQYKRAIAFTDGRKGILSRTIGAVVNDNGDCMVVEVNEVSGNSVFTYDNVVMMKLNLELLGIKLKEEKPQIKEIPLKKPRPIVVGKVEGLREEK